MSFNIVFTSMNYISIYIYNFNISLLGVFENLVKFRGTNEYIIIIIITIIIIDEKTG